ncbi:Ig-like domain-containing protein, partial [Pseudomonas versuta]
MATPNTPAFITQIVDQDIDYTGDIYDRDITVDPTPQLSGSAPVNSHVYIYDDGKLIGSVQADGEGNWSFTPDRDLGTGSHALTVMAHGKMSEPVVITVQASGASTGRPVITSVVDNEGEPGQVEHGATISDKPPTLSGTAAPNAYVEIFSSGRSVGFTQANAEGHWTITPTLPEGLNILSVKSQGQHSDIFTLTVESATSVKPIIESVHDNHGESAMVGDGGSTDDNTPTVSGTARPGAIVQLYANGREVGRAQADSNGNWSITSSALDNGEQVLKVTSDGKFSDGFTINVEASTTPELPELSIQTVYDDQGESGMVGDGGSTDDNTPTVSGTARPGAIVQLYANGREVGRAQADSNGNWSITTSALDNGQQVLKVSSEGKFSDGFTINVEASTTPQLSIQTVYDDQGESGMVGDGGSTDDNTPTVSGTARPGAIVQLYANGREVGRAQADSNGNWSITTSALDNGQQVLKVSSEGKFSDGFTINVEASTTPQLSIQTVYDDQGESGMVGDGGSTDDNTPTVTGTARPGAIVQLYANGREVGRAQADSNGNWSITTSALDNGQQVLKVSSEGKFSDGFTINVEASTT